MKNLLKVVVMKIWYALGEKAKVKDNTPMERLEYSKVRTTIEAKCEEYLKGPGDIFRFEALPQAIDATLACLESPAFLEKYEFAQVSETCFDIRLHELNIL